MSWRAVCECGWRGTPGDRVLADRLAWRHEVRHWTEESCRAQGVPFHVRDRATLAKVATLLVGSPKLLDSARGGR